jgi:hypothetical protein
MVSLGRNVRTVVTAIIMPRVITRMENVYVNQAGEDDTVTKVLIKTVVMSVTISP